MKKWKKSAPEDGDEGEDAAEDGVHAVKAGIDGVVLVQRHLRELDADDLVCLFGVCGQLIYCMNGNCGVVCGWLIRHVMLPTCVHNTYQDEPQQDLGPDAHDDGPAHVEQRLVRV